MVSIYSIEYRLYGSRKQAKDMLERDNDSRLNIYFEKELRILSVLVLRSSECLHAKYYNTMECSGSQNL